MARYIDADEAVRIVKSLSENEDRKYNYYNAEWIIDFLESRPEEDVIRRDSIMILNYPIRELAILAEACKRQQISNEELHEFVTTLENALKVARDSYTVTFDDVTKRFTGTYELPANMAGLYKMMREQGK